MNLNLVLATERVDDVPLLLHLWHEMQLSDLLDQHFPTHGNWHGLSLGQVVSVWLTFIVSQSDHRLNQVQPWAERLIHTLRQASANPDLQALDFSDDRLASVLNYLAAAARWQAFEQAFNQQLLRVYDLQPAIVRLDSTSATSYGQVSGAGLLQFGVSKDHRADLPQFKVMLATLDPLGLPLVTSPVAGNAADDPLYRPAISQVRSAVQRSGLLYIGDSKMGALATRTLVVSGNDYYLCPLAASAFGRHQLRTALDELAAAGPAEELRLPDSDPAAAAIADGYSFEREQSSSLGDQRVNWTERVLLIRSRAQASSQQRHLHERLAATRRALEQLNERKQGRKLCRSIAELQAKVAPILALGGLGDLLQVSYQQDDPAQPARLSVSVAQADVVEAEQLLGWRVYVSNAPAALLKLNQALAAYYGQHYIEHSFSRLKGQALGLSPVYLQDEGRIAALVRLLGLALRGLSVLQYQVRQHLTKAGTELRGLYAGQGGRVTKRPSSEQILAAFKGVSLVLLGEGEAAVAYLTTLNQLQQTLLGALGWSPLVYEDLILNPAIRFVNERTLR
jgi:transposase